MRGHSILLLTLGLALVVGCSAPDRRSSEEEETPDAGSCTSCASDDECGDDRCDLESGCCVPRDEETPDAGEEPDAGGTHEEPDGGGSTPDGGSTPVQPPACGAGRTWNQATDGYPYPISKLSDVSTYNGELVLTDTADLSALRALKRINGTLHIRASGTATVDWTSLGCLEQVSSLQIYMGGGTSVVQGLAGLKKIAGELRFDGPKLTAVQGFGNLTTIDGSFTVRGVASLTQLKGFPRFTTLNGSLDISDVNQLTDLSAFASLTTIGGAFSLYGTGVSDIDVFDGVTSIASGAPHSHGRDIALFFNAHLCEDDAQALIARFPGKRSDTFRNDGLCGP